MIRTVDTAGAAALDGLAGNLSFTWQAGGDGSNKAVTVSNVVVSGVDMRVAGQEASMAEVRFQAASSDGVADPVSIV